MTTTTCITCSVTEPGEVCFGCGTVAALECLDGPDGCSGTVEYRYALSGTGRSFPRCAKHWSDRLRVQEGINRRYPSTPPSDWSPYDAGETWDEEE